MPSDIPVEGEESVVQKPLFKLGTKPLPYTKAPGNNISHLRPKWIVHIAVDEIAVHF